MSLVQQSQQFYPTSVRVTVHQARNLRVKGKGGTNDAYAIIQVAKDKFSTSVSPKCVAPVWKEEASFDLPLFHPGNAERCTLYVIVMHRAQVGLDKFLGQAAVNLLELHDHTARPRTDWFSLVDKTGKADKARGEVLIDIQFMRNNMSASMFDLSMQDKPRSRISKLKDKVRGKRKDGFSDSASAIVPPVSQIVTDSEGEADACSLNQSPGVKKKSKLKSLFAPKSNLQRNISQSMSTLGTLPEKNSSLSGSRSSGLNVDSPEVKKKFKFLGHKRTGSSDSKVSQGPFSILSRSKQSSSDLNNLCINGSHVYAEETEPKSESTLSLNSSGQGSVEDVHRHNSDFSVDSLKGFSVPSYRPEAADKAMLERQRHQEEEERRQAEETRRVEANTLEEERCRAEAKRLHEEKERKYQEEKERQMLEEEKKRKKQVEEEEERQRKEEERRKLLAMENERRLEEERQRRQEEARNVEEQKPQDEASMSDRLSTLFGMIKKKDERKEESHQERFNREQPKPAPYLISQHLEIHGSHQSTNPFEEVPLSPDGQNPFDESPVDNQKPIRSPQTPSAMVFLNRTAKVSAVKPRLVESLKPELIDSQTTSQQRPPSPNTSESTLSSVPSESPDMFYNLHTSLAPPKPKRSSSESPYGSTENLSSSGSSPALSEKRRRAPMPPGYAVYGAQTEISNSRGVSAAGHSSVPVREIENPAYDESDGSKHVKRPPLPLPDYDTLFPQKRHGVQGQTRWDHIIAEVNQKQRDHQAEFFGQEMSVDEPEKPTPRQSSLEKHKHPAHVQQMHPAEIKPISSKRFAAPAPPQTVAATHLRLMADSNQKQSQSVARALQSERPNASAVPVSVNTDATKRESVVSRDGAKKALQPPVIAAHHRNMQWPTPINQKSLDKRPTVVQKELSDTINKEIPTAKPRQKTGDRESVTQSDLDAKSLVTVHNINKGTNQLSHSDGNKLDKIIMEANEKFGGTDPFPCSELISKDTLARVEQNPVVDNLFTGKAQNEQKLEGKGMMADDMDKLFAPFNSTDPFSSFNANDSENSLKSGNQEVVLSQKRKQLPPLPVSSTNTDIKGKQEPALDEDAATVFQSLSDKEANISASQALQPKADVKTQSHWRQPEQAETLFREDPFASDPSTGGSSSSRPFVETPAELQQATMEESASQSGGRTLLRAWVSPSEGQPVSVQNSNGGGLTSTPRRPHPVKPMSSVENLTSTSIPAVREIKIHDGKAAQMKAADSVESGPYTQLTQEELITLVVKQQGELSKKDSKITELEEYIDNLLVRVIEEKPSILLALTSGKLT